MVDDLICTPIPVLSDNFSYLLEWDGGAAVVDPPVVDPILNVLHEKGISPSHILVTHYHRDHTGGVAELKASTGATVYGPNDDRIATLIDVTLKDSDSIDLGPFVFDIMDLPGHTIPHLVYYCAQMNMLLSGDSLFGGGCGRLFDGNADMMHHSLQRLTELPNETRVYFGHEYTLHNLNFMLSILPEQPAIQSRIQAEAMKIEAGGYSTPSSIGLEKETNFLLDPLYPGVARALGLEGRSSAELFAELRRRRDNF